ncbi:HIG1 domain-containing protein [Aphelenchoides fujianensis]|nr:HIG1 domain-containing protein [Aphelenchoides fujianensis]
MSADPAGSPIDEQERLQRRLLWQKVNDPNFAEGEAPSKRKVYQGNSLGRAGVPMIPQEYLAGSSDAVTENKVFRSMSINPLVPVGMFVTVGCLIGHVQGEPQSETCSRRSTTCEVGSPPSSSPFAPSSAAPSTSAWTRAAMRSRAKFPKEQDAITRSMLRNQQ